MKPTIALFAGDPAGIGPELVAKLLAEDAPQRDAHVLLIAARPLEQVACFARVRIDRLRRFGFTHGLRRVTFHQQSLAHQPVTVSKIGVASNRFAGLVAQPCGIF